MLIQFNTDHSVHGSKEFAQSVEDDLRVALARFAERITRLEIHLSDANAGKGGGVDKQCEIEARIAGHPPLSVTDVAATLGHAIHNASRKLEHALDHTFGKLDGPRHVDVRRVQNDGSWETPE
ncbi:MAG: HPF/RaiA family ribosome-associated protein [Pseudomonadota bacterium]|nr:HPF/RaiA family ribosome-associated protein [Pseudomonadota bacterium]